MRRAVVVQRRALSGWTPRSGNSNTSGNNTSNSSGKQRQATPEDTPAAPHTKQGSGPTWVNLHSSNGSSTRSAAGSAMARQGLGSSRGSGSGAAGGESFTAQTLAARLQQLSASKLSPSAKLSGLGPLWSMPKRHAALADLPSESMLQLATILVAARATPDLARLLRELVACQRPPDKDAAAARLILEFMTASGASDLVKPWMDWVASSTSGQQQDGDGASALMADPAAYEMLLRACTAIPSANMPPATYLLRTNLVLQIASQASMRGVVLGASGNSVLLRALGSCIRSLAKLPSVSTPAVAASATSTANNWMLSGDILSTLTNILGPIKPQLTDQGSSGLQKHQKQYQKIEKHHKEATAKVVALAMTVFKEMVAAGTSPSSADCAWLFGHLTSTLQSMEAKSLLEDALRSKTLVRNDLFVTTLRGLLAEHHANAALDLFTKTTKSGAVAPSIESIRLLIHYYTIKEPNLEVVRRLYADMRILAIPLSAEMHSDIVDACRVLCDLPSLLQFTQDDPSLIHESPPIWLLALVDLCVLQGDAAPLERIAGIIEQRAKDGIVSRQQVSQVVQVLLKGGRVAAALRLVRDVLLSPLPGPAAESISERLPRSLTSSLVAALVKANDAVCLRTFAEMLATDHQRFDLDGDALSQLLQHIIAVRDTQDMAVRICMLVTAQTHQEHQQQRQSSNGWPVMPDYSYPELSSRLLDMASAASAADSSIDCEQLAVRVLETAAVSRVYLGRPALSRWKLLIVSKPSLADAQGVLLLIAQMILRRMPVDTDLLQLNTAIWDTTPARRTGATSREKLMDTAFMRLALVRWGLRRKVANSCDWIVHGIEFVLAVPSTGTAADLATARHIRALLSRLAVLQDSQSQDPGANDRYDDHQRQVTTLRQRLEEWLTPLCKSLALGLSQRTAPLVELIGLHTELAGDTLALANAHIDACMLDLPLFKSVGMAPDRQAVEMLFGICLELGRHADVVQLGTFMEASLVSQPGRFAQFLRSCGAVDAAGGTAGFEAICAVLLQSCKDDLWRSGTEQDGPILIPPPKFWKCLQAVLEDLHSQQHPSLAKNANAAANSTRAAQLFASAVGSIISSGQLVHGSTPADLDAFSRLCRSMAMMYGSRVAGDAVHTLGWLARMQPHLLNNQDRQMVLRLATTLLQSATASTADTDKAIACVETHVIGAAMVSSLAVASAGSGDVKVDNRASLARVFELLWSQSDYRAVGLLRAMVAVTGPHADYRREVSALLPRLLDLIVEKQRVSDMWGLYSDVGRNMRRHLAGPVDGGTREYGWFWRDDVIPLVLGAMVVMSRNVRVQDLPTAGEQATMARIHHRVGLDKRRGPSAMAMGKDAEADADVDGVDSVTPVTAS